MTSTELAGRRRAARTDAATSVAASEATATSFGTTRAATPRDTDRGGTSRIDEPHQITPEEALANTRALLEAKQAHDRQPPAWRQFDRAAGQPASGSPETHDAAREAEAEAHAEDLHRAESRLEAIQGSVSTQDRHRQGERDAND